MTQPHYADEAVTLWHGDAIKVMRQMPAASVDAVVCDPPYALPGGFMGKSWDAFASPAAFAEFSRTWAVECLRVLKPGGHLLASGGTRTWHRLTCGIEDAGFEIRDGVADLTGQDAPGLMWIQAQGFPKSLDVSKAIDKAAGAEREVVGEGSPFGRGAMGNRSRVAAGYRPTELNPEGGAAQITAPATDEARRWQGWGTALRPAWEPIVVARKPLAGTVAQTVQAYGTGALNVDACRVAHASADDLAASLAKNPGRDDSVTSGVYGADRPQQTVNVAGRWPANVVLSHVMVWNGGDACSGPDGCVPGCPVAELDAQSGVSVSAARLPTGRDTRGIPNGSTPVTRFADTLERGHSDSGGASRFFPTFRYEAKAPSSERPRDGDVSHPTVKPLDLMRWLVRLVTPPGGLVLDPFAGSGTTGEACVLEGFRCHLIELEAAHLPLIVKRLAKPMQLGLFGTEA